MTAETVSLSLDDSGAAWIRVNRPERHNAMTAAMYEALLECIAAARADARVRCVLLQGEGGKSFISGTDISHFKDFTHGKQGNEYEAFVERVIDAVERISVPTIAVIDGWAVGGGLALATACDFRICTPKSRFGAPIAKTLSNTLSSRNMARLAAALGVPRVKRMLLLADYLGAEDMLNCGFVQSIASAETLIDESRQLADKLMALSGTTQAAVKESLRRIVVDNDLHDVDLVESVYGSAAFRSGVAAFIKS
ncbi:enoyl-CoA hydratase [Diaphorobacter caeni]|uniref:enoyl-CoA hydratase n=1 Tax=Diaphorobacter caeni TaxID=2784387 RepID=UPI00188FA620|nr:enoyl-CoA hydratase [Diaphorobacter caeni]MBF5007453.1 enoyl-CoA hydratase/isomerase family protein [Diaphorobacter caeni]